MVDCVLGGWGGRAYLCEVGVFKKSCKFVISFCSHCIISHCFSLWSVGDVTGMLSVFVFSGLVTMLGFPNMGGVVVSVWVKVLGGGVEGWKGKIGWLKGRLWGFFITGFWCKVGSPFVVIGVSSGTPIS